MPTYHYICSNEECKHDLRVIRSMKDEVLTLCPQCKKESLGMVFYSPQIIIKCDPKTIGALAERNTNSLGQYEREDMWQAKKDVKIMAKKAAQEKLAARLPEGASIAMPVNDKTNLDIDPIIKKLGTSTMDEKIKFIEDGVI